jgi:hypothetical protein
MPKGRQFDIRIYTLLQLCVCIFLNIGLIAGLIACLRYLRACVWQELLAYRNSSEVACMSEVFGSTTKTCVELCDLVLLNAAKTKSLALATLWTLDWTDWMAGELKSVRLLFPQVFGLFFVVRTWHLESERKCTSCFRRFVRYSSWITANGKQWGSHKLEYWCVTTCQHVVCLETSARLEDLRLSTVPLKRIFKC